MADSDNTLKLLIDMGVVGNDDVKAAKELFAEMTHAVSDVAGEEEKTGEKTRSYAAENKALVEIMGSFNQMIPGLGSAMSMLTAGYLEEAAAAKAGAVANETFILSMGPLALVMLTIQAATEYWNLYKEKAEAAAEAQKVALDNIRGAFREAREEQEKFDAAQNKASQSSDMYATALAHQTAVLKAQLNQKLELMKVQEAADVATANTPEEKAKVRERYAKIEDADKFEEKKAETATLEKLAGEIDERIKKATSDKQVVENELKAEGAKPASEAGADKIKDLDKQISGFNEVILGLTRKRTDYRDRAELNHAGEDIEDVTRSKVAAARSQSPGDSTVADAVPGIDVAYNRGKVSEDQKKHIDDLKTLFTTIFGNTDHLMEAVRYAHAHGLNQQQEIVLIKNQLKALAGGGAR